MSATIINGKIRHVLAIILVSVATTPAKADQWVHGYVETLEDYGGYQGGALGVLISLKQKAWGDTDGGPPTGSANCTERLHLQTGAAGVDENMKNRIFSLLLTAANTQRRVGLFVKTDTGPFCQVISGSYGTESRNPPASN